MCILYSYCCSNTVIRDYNNITHTIILIYLPEHTPNAVFAKQLTSVEQGLLILVPVILHEHTLHHPQMALAIDW